MSSKGELRRQYRNVIKERGHTGHALRRLNQVLSNWLVDHVTSKSQIPQTGTSIWAAFQALPGEPDLTDTYAHLYVQGWRFAFPAVVGERLHFYEPPAHESGWTEGPWGLKEPNPETSREIPAAQMIGVLVPGLAFDRKGGRLGRGKGYYDRALENFTGIKVGVAFSDQMASEIPCDEYDIRMNWIVTEDGVLELPARDPAAARAEMERKGS